MTVATGEIGLLDDRPAAFPSTVENSRNPARERQPIEIL